MSKLCPECGNINFNNAYQCKACKHIFNDVIKCLKCGVYNLSCWKQCIQCRNELILSDSNKETTNKDILVGALKIENDHINNNDLKINFDIESLRQILNNIVKDRGIKVLSDAKICNALLLDYAKGEIKKEIRLLIQVLNTGCYKTIEVSQELDIEKLKLIKKLTDEYFIEKGIAISIVNLIIETIKYCA
jgi:hypothetical protein